MAGREEVFAVGGHEVIAGHEPQGGSYIYHYFSNKGGFGANQADARSASDGPTESRPNREPADQLAHDAGFGSWIAELQERRVLRSAVLYIAIGWGFAESATFVAENLNAPDWVSTVIVYAFIAGFPLVILLSWIFDLRVVRDSDAVSSSSRKKTIWLIVLLVLLSAAAIWRFATLDP